MDLHLFSQSFPLGRGEQFLEAELPALVRVFGRIKLIPYLEAEDLGRSLPSGVELVRPLVPMKAGRRLGPALWSAHRVLPTFVRDAVANRTRVRLRPWVAALVRTACALTRLRAAGLDRTAATRYSYWGDGAALLAPFLLPDGGFVARFHGFDLYEEVRDGYLPLRNALVECLTAFVFVSEQGMRYFVVRYPRAASRSRLFRLGTLDSGSAPPHSDNVFRVVTCARAEPLKRLDLLAEALRSARGEIEWTHIGNGSDMNRIRRIATEFPPGVRFVEEGYLPSWEVVERYRRKPFDVFVNVSRSEGLPVSIMEALSFGIPVVASDVGGNAEALTKDCGILLSANPSPEEVREVLEKIRRATVPERDRMRRAARAHWEIRFRGERNFGEFAVWLSELEPTATSNHD